MSEPKYRAKFRLVNREQKRAASKEAERYDKLFTISEDEFTELLFEASYEYKVLYRWISMLHKRFSEQMRGDRFVIYLEPNERYLDYLKPLETLEVTPFEKLLIKIYRRIR